MGDRSAGIIIAFALVSIAAVSVSFLSATKMKRSERRVDLLRSEVERLSQAEKALLADLRETQAQYDQETQNLKAALAQEELRNETLAQELHGGRPERRTAQNVGQTESRTENASSDSDQTSTTKTNWQ